MTGPQHYREAEQLLASLQNMERGALAELPTIAEAQVHATLAHAAAVAELDAFADPHGSGSAYGRQTDDAEQWGRVLAPEEPT